MKKCLFTCSLTVTYDLVDSMLGGGKLAEHCHCIWSLILYGEIGSQE